MRRPEAQGRAGRWARLRLDRWIERELTEGLSARQRARLHEQLRRDPRARARYDRAVAAVRVLEGDGELAPTELDLVGRWLAADDDREAAEPARRWWPAVLGALAAAVLLLWVSPLRDPDAFVPLSEHDGWAPRGGALDDQGRGLALEVLCGPADTPDPQLRVRECRHRDLLGFAYRASPGVAGELSLFGVDADGDPMFYLPTPVDAAGVTVDPGHWRALRLAIRLWVNHAPGSLRIYGVVAPVVATPDEVRTWAQQLSSQSPARPGEQPWIERVDPATRSRLCPAAADCRAAELSLTLDP